ncbi:ABC transporter permease [Candidatus Cryosericum hinesii]|jgi:simple sugar transport system permease protein|uniref:ABC transporter permease n=1 Tax=Candidatus Cryosericum hinesii TaxID=2290915 RepID=A0A398DCA5_9BACT|nr:ABC transporter permease [Candidatus Cryosericum hinesii]RIE08607.1 ABC transporter permease [Candidatus Cryosericum hinesii]RIE12300.1 ABC transporter permease [Candidatus Cryosericum hinesii]RIE12434.1 ABC transporter permease [Candidatus Cryosericum hinesii]
MNIAQINLTIAQMLDYTMPILFAALCGVLSENAGVVNIGLDGIMRFGAFFGLLGAFFSHSPWIGLLFGIAIGCLVGALHAFITIRWNGDQTVSGVAINVIAVGLMTYLLEFVFSTTGYSPQIQNYFGAQAYRVHLPFLAKIPLLGAFSNLSFMIWFGFICTVLMHVLLYHTVLGLRIRTCGENPKAATTLGINVFRIRWFAVVAGAALAGIGGATLSISSFSGFSDSMPNGVGFIGLAAMIFGKWTPFGALGAALLFGTGQIVQSIIAVTGIAPKLAPGLTLILPYVLTLAVLAGFVGKSIAPAADGLPYYKEQR